LAELEGSESVIIRLKEYWTTRQIRMTTMPRIATPLLLIVFMSPALAQVLPPEAEPRGHRLDERYIPKNESPWREGAVEVPGNPDDSDLVEIGGVPGAHGITHYIDSETLTVGEDRVTRYTMVLVTRGGVRNVLYEGLRCSEGIYRTYASGTGYSELVPNTNPDWRMVEKDGAYAYRDLLATSALCTPSQVARSPREALQRLKYPNHYQSTVPR